jgi:hypothetical protein
MYSFNSALARSETWLAPHFVMLLKEAIVSLPNTIGTQFLRLVRNFSFSKKVRSAKMLGWRVAKISKTLPKIEAMLEESIEGKLPQSEVKK